MTTPWTITPEWKGLSVAVLASGPSMSQKLAESLRKQCDKVIAVNDSHVLAPWADMLVNLDADWPADYLTFKGRRVTGVADDALDALYIGPRYETVTIARNHVIEVCNSGVTAVRIASLMGAARIVLAGFDYPHRTGHFYDDEVDTGQYLGVPEAIAALVDQLRAGRVVVEVAS